MRLFTKWQVIILILSVVIIGIVSVSQYHSNQWADESVMLHPEAPPPYTPPEILQSDPYINSETKQEIYKNDMHQTIYATEFANDCFYEFYAINFNETIDGKRHEQNVFLPGSQITIRTQHYTTQENYWNQTSDISLSHKGLLFVETDAGSMIISMPGVYEQLGHQSIESVPNEELPLTIEKTPTGYTFSASFPINQSYQCELWYLKSGQPLVQWSDYTEKIWISQDLYSNQRWCEDGYYFKTYTNYDPYTQESFFRHPSNYPGAHLMRNDAGLGADCLGYVMTKTCMQNQNDEGYWKTGPQVSWLLEDFGIAFGFYDTRFCTDFAQSLVSGYIKYGCPEFLESARSYGDFFYDYALKHGYNLTETKSGDTKGLLVPDYWSADQQIKPHVSLNHQLAEINFLFELYQATGTDRYYEMGIALLQGVRSTYQQWVMPDHNLKYALYYDGSANIMVDYPYLTYNDLISTKGILISLGLDYVEIQTLMDYKKSWMDENEVIGYKPDIHTN